MLAEVLRLAQSAAASLTDAQQGYEIQINQNLSDVQSAQQDARFARMDFDKYLGESVTQVVLDQIGLEKELPVHLRTGDTTQANRARFRRSGATFLVTTPESLAVMLAQEDYAAHLRHCRFVIVDELHSFAGNKRGADLSISLERLERICRSGNPEQSDRLCRVRPAAERRRPGGTRP